MSEINEKISAWFEPFESLPDPMTWDSSIRGEYSPKGIWVMGYGAGVHKSWLSRRIQWDTDEAANARLLEAMPSPVLALETLHAPQWGCWPLGLHLTPVAMRAADRDRKTAVVMAFCKWAGIEVEP